MSHPKKTSQTNRPGLGDFVGRKASPKGAEISRSHAMQKPYAPTERTENADQDKKHVSSLTTPVRLGERPLPDEA
jgi:hypothetical protein